MPASAHNLQVQDHSEQVQNVADLPQHRDEPEHEHGVEDEDVRGPLAEDVEGVVEHGAVGPEVLRLPIVLRLLRVTDEWDVPVGAEYRAVGHDNLAVLAP